MAQMTSEQRDALCAELQRLFSATWSEVPLTKAQLRTAIDIFDAGMENAESVILANVSTEARTWLVSHVPLARFILARVAEERQEVL